MAGGYGIVIRACRGRHGGVAQLARACGSYPQCHRFKSSRRYHTGEMRQHLSGIPLENGPLVKRLRHGPFTAVTWVRFPYGSPCRHPKGRRQFGGLAQLVRAPASHAGGHWFESSSLHQNLTSSEVRFFCFAQKKDIVSFSGKSKKRERKNRSLFFHQIVVAYLALAAR